MAIKLNQDNQEYPKALERVKDPLNQGSDEETQIAATLQRVSDLLSRSDRDGAVKVLTDALEKRPHQAALELVLKNLLVAAPKTEKSASITSTQDVQLLMTEADIYLSKGRPDLAKKNLQEALKAQPQNEEVKQKLAHIEAPTQTVSQVKMKAAQDLYEKGLKMYLDGDLDGAIHAWEEALKDDPNHTKAQNNLVRAKLEKESEKP